jgi:DNA-binding MurR/RpiR family transcriptional regulator
MPPVLPDPADRPASLAALQARLQQLSGTLPRRLQQCADHLAAHPRRVALSTVAEVARAAGVHPSAVMRLCGTLGFAGFSDLQRLLRDALTEAPDYATRLAGLIAGQDGRPATLVAECVEAGRRSLEALAQDLDEPALDQAVAALARARVIHLAGFRRSFPVAAYLAYVFDRLGVPAVLHDGVAGLGQTAILAPGDALIAITFPPHAAETLALAARARASGLPVVLITDPAARHVALPGDHVLAVQEIDFGAFRALSAVIALALSVAVAVAAARTG